MSRNPRGSDLYFLYFRFAKIQKDKRQTLFYSDRLLVMPQTQRAGFPLTLELSKEELPKKSWVKISQVWTLSVERIKGKITGIT